MAKFWTADWHIDDEYGPGSHTFLRPKPTAQLADEWLNECYRLITQDDELYLLGDMASNIQNWKFYDDLPDCRLFIMYGNREDKINNFEEELYKRLGRHRNRMTILGRHSSAVECVTVDDATWRMSHLPVNLFGFSAPHPSLCGHVHGTWRTQCLSDGMPIINVGIDAWGRLVTEDHLRHERTALEKGYYDINVRVDLWHKQRG